MKQLTTPTSAVEYKLVMLSGPEKGTVYKLLTAQVVLGRGTDCDIVLAYDQKCSRRHAMITHNGTEFEIRDISDRNKLIIDGVETKLALLRESSEILLGETRLKFQMSSHTPTLHAVTSPLAPPPDIPVRLQNKINPVRIVLIIIAVGFAILMLTSSPKKSPETLIRTDEQVQADIAAANALKDAAVQQRKGPTDDLSTEEAQAAYIRGFRDYRKGQYGRALESFQACLTIYPQHVLCNRYLRLSQRKYNELIEYEMVLGRKYRDQEQYAPCSASFKNVMSMIQDSTNTTFKEAQANFQACQAFMEGRY